MRAPERTARHDIVEHPNVVDSDRCAKPLAFDHSSGKSFNSAIECGAIRCEMFERTYRKRRLFAKIDFQFDFT